MSSSTDAVDRASVDLVARAVVGVIVGGYALLQKLAGRRGAESNATEEKTIAGWPLVVTSAIVLIGGVVAACSLVATVRAGLPRHGEPRAASVTSR